MENSRALKRFLKSGKLARRCSLCGHYIDLGQEVPSEVPQSGLTKPFSNSKGREEYNRSGLCQACQDMLYGKED